MDIFTCISTERNIQLWFLLLKNYMSNKVVVLLVYMPDCYHSEGEVDINALN